MNSPHSGNAACVICGQIRVKRYWPFCSNRCANIDLGRWLRGSYAIPSEEMIDEEGDSVEIANTKLD